MGMELVMSEPHATTIQVVIMSILLIAVGVALFRLSVAMLKEFIQEIQEK